MRLPESKLKLTLLTTVAVFLGAVAICQIFEWMGFPEQDQVKAIKEMAGWNARFVFVVVWVLIATPLIEEFLFRYLLFRLPFLHMAIVEMLFRYLLYRLPSRLVSKEEPPQFSTFHLSLLLSVLSSALFSFCHYIDFNSLSHGKGFALLPISNAFLALFFVGLAWCWLYRRTGSLWCSMLSHSVFNGVNLILALLI